MENLIYNETPTFFPWYDKLEKQNRFKENVLPGCDFKLIAPYNTILPFQFRKPKAPEMPTGWHVHFRDGGDAIDISNNISLIRGKSLEGMDYIYFCGEQLVFNRETGGNIAPEALNLPTGFYYSVITFPSSAFYSEVFMVPSKGFLFGDYVTNPYLRLECYNSGDMAPFFYNDKVDGIPRYKNTLFIDSFTYASNVEITEEGEKDGNGILIPDFQMAVIKYNLTLLVPDFLKLALVIIQIHSNVYLYEKKGVRSGRLKRIATNTGLEANGALSTVDITYEQDLAISRSGCNNNLLADEQSETVLSLTSITKTPGVSLKFTGVAPEDAWVQIWGSETEGGVYQKLADNKTPAQLAAGIMLNANEYLGKSWFYIAALGWNYNYGHTVAVIKPA